MEGDRGFKIRQVGHDHFYPRPPGGGRLEARRKDFEQAEISIHALRVEGDEMDLWAAVLKLMISIHALRVEGDGSGVNSVDAFSISIHALRVEGDAITSMTTT